MLEQPKPIARAHDHAHGHDHTHGRWIDIDTLVAYLLEKGVLASKDVVEGKFEVHDLTRRNKNFRIVLPNGGGVLVKQPKSASERGLAASFLNEVEFLKVAARDVAMEKLARNIPRLVYYDPDEMLLAIELIHPATTLTKYYLNAGQIEFHEDGGKSSARLLAEFHARALRVHAEGSLKLPLTGFPIGLTVTDHLALRARQRDPAAMSFLREIEGSPLASGGKAVLAGREAWSGHEEVVHGDARWDNYLLTYGAGLGGGLNLRLIDWELVCKGDSAYDVASYIGEFIRFRMATAMVRPAHDAEEAERNAVFPLEKCAPAARTFWVAYAKARKLTGKKRAEFLARVAAYLPAYLTLVSWEMTSKFNGKEGQLSPVALAVLSTAKSMAEAPAEWLAQNLGVTE